MKNTTSPRQNKCSARDEENPNENQGASNLRDEYNLEKQRIIAEFGGLRGMRDVLGLSQRRLCRLLMVDPSAWTRWNKTDAPPHIYQALKWLIELKKINPEVTGPADLHKRVDLIQSSTQAKIAELEKTVEMLERALALQSTTQTSALPPASNDDIETALIFQEKRLLAKMDYLESQILAVAQARPVKNPKPKAKSKQKSKLKTRIKTKKVMAKRKPKAHRNAKAKGKSKLFSKAKIRPKLKTKPKHKPKRKK